jgi:hypothetical protein
MANHTGKVDCLKTTSYEEALDCCLDELEKGSKLPLDTGVRATIRKQSLEVFKNNHSQWPAYGKKVLRSASQIGKYSEDFARFDAEINGHPEPDKVKEKHAWHAIEVVKKLCPAGRGEDFFKWCPDPEP